MHYRNYLLSTVFPVNNSKIEFFSVTAGAERNPPCNELRPVRRSCRGPCDRRDGTRRLWCLLLFPLRGFRRFAPILIQLHDPFAGAVEVIPVEDVYPIFSR
jgi:hypothetical protein